MGFLFALVMFSFLHGIEDKLIQNQLVFEGDRFLQEYTQSPNTPMPQTISMNGYLGLDSMPANIRAWAKDQKPGLHESYFEDYHFYVLPLPDRPDYFYLVYHVEGIEPLETLSLSEISILGILVVTIFSGFFGYLIANRMLAPLMRLTQMVTEIKPEDTSLATDGLFYDDEVGHLANNFRDSLERIGAYVARERRFTRDASHEFRTPVTVIKGATELLTLREKDLPSQKALHRIQRAVRDLENIIETFLYLGRQGSQQDQDGSCAIRPVVEDALEQNRYLLEGKPVSVSLKADVGFQVEAPRAVVSITIGNLIRNSFQYTETGCVSVVLGQRMIRIQDTGRGIAENDLAQIVHREKRATHGDGFGLGLSIVSDFCQRYGWHLDIRSELGTGTCVELHFQPKTTAITNQPNLH